MKKLLTTFAVALALVFASPAAAKVATPYHYHCSPKQSAKIELKCGHRSLFHDRAMMRFIKNHPPVAPPLLGLLPPPLGKAFHDFQVHQFLARHHLHSLKFYHWHQKVDQRWIAEAKARLPLPYTNNWVTAVRIVQRVWPGTASFMLDCSAHEGGHGPFVMNYQGSPAGGWMQYFETTWASHYSSAIAYARLHHLTLPPPQAGRWTSPLGQAFAAGWGFHYNHSAWTGDPYCW